MRILSLTYEFPPIGGGGGVIAAALAEALGSFGHRVDVVTSHTGDLPIREQLGPLTIHRVPCFRIHRHYSNMVELAALLWPLYRKARELTAQNRYDFNHTHFAIPTGLIAHRLWRRTGLPYVLTLHGSDVPGYNPDRFNLTHTLIRPIWHRILRDASLVVSPSQFLADLTARHSDVPIRIIANGYDPLAGAYPPKRNRILLVSRMFERKGVQFFLQAMRDWTTDWEILIAGDGPYLPRLRSIAREIRARVDFTGFIDRARLFDLYGTSRIFVFPSIQENFPVVLLEAMHAGCAIVTTDAPGCAEVVGAAGIQLPTENSDAIRDTLMQLVSNPAQVDHYAAAARVRAETFRWPKIASQYDEAFRSIFSAV